MGIVMIACVLAILKENSRDDLIYSEFDIKKNVEKTSLDSLLDVGIKGLKKHKLIKRDPLHQGLIAERSKLRARNFDLNLDARVGKSHLIGNSSISHKKVGFYCSVCKCVLKDSSTYLDHINGRWHQRSLGMSMRIEKVGVDRVHNRLQSCL